MVLLFAVVDVAFELADGLGVTRLLRVLGLLRRLSVALGLGAERRAGVAVLALVHFTVSVS